MVAAIGFDYPLYRKKAGNFLDPLWDLDKELFQIKYQIILEINNRKWAVENPSAVVCYDWSKCRNLPNVLLTDGELFVSTGWMQNMWRLNSAIKRKKP